MPNAITMLKADHATVKRLLRELSQTTERAVKERERPVSEIERELETHAQLEEEVFYALEVLGIGVFGALATSCRRGATSSKRCGRAPLLRPVKKLQSAASDRNEAR